MKIPELLKSRRILPAAVLVAILLGVIVHLEAADHKDSPAAEEGNLDITDVYAFGAGDSLVLIMNVSPLLTPGSATEAARFNNAGLYQFKLDAQRDGVEEAVIQVTFSDSADTQRVHVRGPAAPAAKGPEGNRLLADSSAGVVSGAFDRVFGDSGLTAFAGPRDDPFFLHLLGDSSLTSVLNAAYGAALDTTVGAPGEQTLAFSGEGPDDFAGTNVLSIAVRVPKASIAGALGVDSAATIFVWGTTSLRD
jgi:hypothetical protein